MELSGDHVGAEASRGEHRSRTCADGPDAGAAEGAGVEASFLQGAEEACRAVGAGEQDGVVAR